MQSVRIEGAYRARREDQAATGAILMNEGRITYAVGGRG
jgi:hypothetical protein